MLSPTGHAIALIGMVAATAAACLLAKRERPTARRVTVTLAGSFVAFLLAALSFSHLCSAGNPVMQALIPALCIAAVNVCVASHVARWTGTVTVLAAMIALCHQYTEIVHEPGVTGSPPAWPALARQRLATLGAATAARFRDDRRSYAAGWLEDAEFLAADAALLEEAREARPASAERHWHSWFTWLYSVRPLPQAAWFPGGTPAEGAARLEWRERTH